MTVREYEASSRWRRLGYRLMRSPFVLFVIAPMYLFLVQHRIPSRGSRPRERRSVWVTNLGVVALISGMGLALGFKTVLLVQLPISMIGTVGGVWLFYVQHQFEGTYWARGAQWDFVGAALHGSSFYKLPKVLQWFSGNIGFHHIHHLSPSIPNYNLEKCHDEEPAFQAVQAVTLWGSLRSLTFRLWDERQRRLVGWRGWRRQRAT